MIHVPPPLIYAAAFGAGWLLERWVPLDLPGSRWLRAPGLALLALGVLTLAWAVAALVRAGTTVRPDRPARALVTTGPFRRTRNPIYLAFALVYVGAALLLASVWPLVLLPAAVWAVDRLVIPREERHLTAAFPAAYAEYRRRVRRWV